MKIGQKSISVAALLCSAGLAQAQFTENFDTILGTIGTPMAPAGWTAVNNSGAIGLTSWFQGNTAVFPQFGGAGYLGGNFNSASGLNTISLWMISPVTALSNGGTLSFYTRTVDAPFFPDRLQVRMNKANTGTNVGSGPNDVGDFSDLLLDINPNYTTTEYPSTWTEFTATVSGVSGTVNGRLAFRYFVENGGPSGANSDYIGIDEASYVVGGIPTGRCCLPNGSCQVLTQNQCNTANGTNWVSGTDCTGANCPQPPTGACCFLDGTCQLVNTFDCAAAGGIFKGNNTACSACPNVYTYTGGSVPIPDGTGNATCGTEAVAEIVVNQSYTITSAEAAFHILHTWQGDITISLTKVGGPTVVMVDRPGVPASTFGFTTDNYGASVANADLFISTDSAAQVYDAPVAAVNNVKGPWKPENPLSAFNGLNAQGTWRLVVTDCAGGDLGSIEAFKLLLGGPTGPAPCYANCDGSTGSPLLTANDFQCFLNKYAGGDTYANCDGSTGNPLLTANDFQCFLNKYAGGCS
jgi:subtilisin-like proprotein convertase family protein